MSEAKHTAGDWSVLEHDGEIFVLADGAMQIAAVTYVIEQAGETGSRRLQNARLMAAAPKLLEALQALRLAREQDKYRSWERGVPKFNEAEALADAAIAKALS